MQGWGHLIYQAVRTKYSLLETLTRPVLSDLSPKRETWHVHRRRGAGASDFNETESMAGDGGAGEISVPQTILKTSKIVQGKPFALVLLSLISVMTLTLLLVSGELWGGGEGITGVKYTTHHR